MDTRTTRKRRTIRIKNKKEKNAFTLSPREFRTDTQVNMVKDETSLWFSGRYGATYCDKRVLSRFFLQPPAVEQSGPCKWLSVLSFSWFVSSLIKCRLFSVLVYAKQNKKKIGRVVQRRGKIEDYFLIGRKSFIFASSMKTKTFCLWNTLLEYKVSIK